MAALFARSEFIPIMIGFHDVILVKTDGLTVLLFLFFLLLRFNHFVKEGLAKAVDVIHALLGKAPKIKVPKNTYVFECPSFSHFSNGIFGHFFLSGWKPRTS
jgi:hypothetical protein